MLNCGKCVKIKNDSHFLASEKRNFLKACQENGLSVIYDLKKLGEYLPGRSETEIR